MPNQKVRLAILFVSMLSFSVVINYFSPYLIIDATTQGIINGSFIVFILLFVSSLFLGRYWCGHICPVGALQEFCGKVHDKKAKGGKANWIKYFIWVPWIGTIVTLAVMVGGYKEINFFYNTESGVSIDAPQRYILYFFIVLGLTALVLIAGKRASCHYICWMAPFMILGTLIKNKFKWPSYHLEAETEKCTQCKTCDNVCPMSLNVSEMVIEAKMQNSECILCGACVNNCPQAVIRTAWKWSKKK